jgi:magnesium-transporting ATPase (P-type)
MLASFAFGEWTEGIAVGAVILINVAIGFFTRLQAVRSMEMLQRLGRLNARVRREDQGGTASAADGVQRTNGPGWPTCPGPANQIEVNDSK